MILVGTNISSSFRNFEKLRGFNEQREPSRGLFMNYLLLILVPDHQQTSPRLVSNLPTGGGTGTRLVALIIMGRA